MGIKVGIFTKNNRNSRKRLGVEGGKGDSGLKIAGRRKEKNSSSISKSSCKTGRGAEGVDR